MTSDADAIDVIVIDDDVDIRGLVVMALEMAECRPHAAADGRGGFALIKGLVGRGLRPVVVLDVQMPDVDGWSVLRQVRADASLDHVPVVLCTVRAGVPDQEHGFELGADAYEAKPFDLVTLIATIRRLHALSDDELRTARVLARENADD